MNEADLREWLSRAPIKTMVPVSLFEYATGHKREPESPRITWEGSIWVAVTVEDDVYIRRDEEL